MLRLNKRNDDIEVLRAFAILFVMVEHCGSLVKTRDGFFHRMTSHYFSFWTGVDLFFAISGFVIARSLIETLGRADAIGKRERVIEAIAFWIRRAWRLLPAAWLWIAIPFALSLTGWGMKHDFGTLAPAATEAIASFFEIQNFHQYYSCYAHQGTCGPWVLAPYWSLSLEEQFYWVLPVLWMLIPDRFLNWALLALIAVQFPLVRLAEGRGLLWFVRTDALAWGVLLARLYGAPYYQYAEPRFLDRPGARAFFVFFALTMMASPYLEQGIVFYMGLVAGAAAALVFAASFDKGYIMRGTGPLKHVLLWIGSRSYALYLSNAPCYMLVRNLTWNIPRTLPVAIGIFALAMAVNACAAELTWRLVERRLRLKGRAIADLFVARHRAEEGLPPRPEAHTPLRAIANAV